jgi:hypothetical protein
MRLAERLIFLERLTPQALESIIAFKPQSTIGDKVVQVIYQAGKRSKMAYECPYGLEYS